MADNLSPLVNLDLINQIYRTINAQITERVYDPNYYSAATLGDANHRYVNAYLKALNVSGDVTITGNITGVKNISATTFNNLTLKANTTGFEISGGTTSKKLKVADTTSIDKPLTISANTTISANLTVSAATKIIKELTVGADNTGTVAIKSAGAGNTTIVGPSGATAQFNVETTIGDTTCTGPVTIRSSSTGSTTIIGPNGGIAKLKAGTCVIADDCSTANTADKIVQRDSSKDIKVTSVNSVNISTDANKVALSKGTASVAVSANAAAVVNKNLTVSSIATLGSTDSGKTGEIVIMSDGTGKATITGPSNGTAKLKNGTCLVEADATTVANDSKIVQRSKGNISVSTVNNAGIKGESNTVTLSSGTTTASIQKNLSVYSITDLGSDANTGAISIQPSGAKSLTINGPSDGIPVNLVSGDYQNSATTACSTGNEASKIVQRDSSGDILVEKVNGVKLSSASTGFTAAGGTASRTLKVNSAATLGSTASGETGGVVVKSEGVKTTTIVGPNDGTARLKNGTCIVEDDLPNVTVGSATTATINSWTDNEIHYLATVKASGENQGISAETDSTKKLYIERKTVDNATTYHFYAGAVHNAVWNDLADCIEVPEDTNLEFGYCYSWNGDKVEKSSRKSRNCIGIHSNTAGLFMGEKPVKTIQAAVAGFVLAHMDRAYPEGTPLTWGDDGKLVKCGVVKRILHPERVIATFYKEETQETWHGVKVHDRHWVKVR